MALFRSRIKAALFIDFENVPLNPEGIGKVIDWLEDGMFDEARAKRRVVIRRVYWNSQGNRHRKAYEDQGFEAILIEKYAGLKNGADIRIAMDMLEAALGRKAIDEFILISRDSDFIPVIQRLGEREKRTVMMVEEQQPSIFTAYNLHADAIILHRQLITDAATYVRPRRGLIAKLGFSSRGSKPKPGTKPVAINGSTHPATADEIAPDAHATPAAPSKKQLIDQAVDAFLKVASRNPGKLTGKQTIMKQLKAIKGFTNTGNDPYLGYKTYDTLAKEVATRDRRITLQLDRLGGITVVYVPSDGEAPAGPTPSGKVVTERPQVRPAAQRSAASTTSSATAHPSSGTPSLAVASGTTSDAGMIDPSPPSDGVADQPPVPPAPTSEPAKSNAT